KPSLGRAVAVALPRSAGVNKDRQAINISPRWGKATNNDLLHFQLESAYGKFPLRSLWVDSTNDSTNPGQAGMPVLLQLEKTLHAVFSSETKYERRLEVI
ncbi:MAG TPA: hypothetical protein VGO73_00400, partial [Pyrinomonadaceae bacterium]|nr:hypothetical protein [Pyrinomonadaceae bacterium]